MEDSSTSGYLRAFCCKADSAPRAHRIRRTAQVTAVIALLLASAPASATDQIPSPPALQESVTSRCKLAGLLQNAGLAAEARNAYELILKDESLLKAAVNLDCASNGLRQTRNALNEQALERAKTLARLGFADDARKIIKENLEARSNLALPPELRNLAPPAIPDWHATIQRFVAETVVPIGETLLLVVLVFAFVYLALRRWLWLTPALDMVPGKDAAKSSLSGEFCGAIESHILRVRDLAPRSNFLLVKESPTAAAVDFRVTAASSSWLAKLPWLDSLQKLIVWLVYRPPLELAGQHLFKEGRGRGVSLQLICNRGILAATEFWESDFKFPPTGKEQLQEIAEQPLARLAAIWLMSELAAQPVTIWQWSRHFWAWLRGRAAPNSKADVLVQAAQEAFARDHDQTSDARALYIEALRIAPDHLGARINLARLLFAGDDTSAASRQRALTLLTRARELVSRSGHDRRAAHARHPALFNLAAVCIDLDRFADAQGYAKELVSSTKAGIQRSRGSLRAYLQVNLPVAKCVLAGTLAAVRDPTAADLLQDKDIAGLGESMRVTDRYNLACTYALFAEFAPAPEQEGYAAMALTHLKEALWLSQTGAEQAPAKRLAHRAQNHDRAFKWLRDTPPHKMAFAAITAAIVESDASGPAPQGRRPPVGVGT